MISYPYDSEFNPPAPVLNIDISDPLLKKKIEGIRCQLDTGADMTVIPQEVISLLNLPFADTISVADYRGSIIEQDVYWAKVTFCNREFMVKIIGTPEDTGLIGRDILNQWTILLDGKRQQFNITQKPWRFLEIEE